MNLIYINNVLSSFDNLIQLSKDFTITITNRLNDIKYEREFLIEDIKSNLIYDC